MPCESCLKGKESKCAFDKDGIFTEDNWGCDSLNELWEKAERWDSVVYNEIDEQCAVLPAENGFVVLTRYKTRGKTMSAHYIQEGVEPTPLMMGDLKELLK